MSFLILRNNTAFIAQFVVSRGQQVIARIPGLAPGAQLQVPTAAVYQVVATTVIEGNTYTSAPLEVTGAAGFLAQVRQHAAQGTYQFEAVQVASTRPDELQFRKTSLSPVTFTIARNGVMLQTLVVANSFQMVTLNIGDTYSIFAVINGVTTDTVTTTDPDATITAIADTSGLEFGYVTLQVG